MIDKNLLAVAFAGAFLALAGCDGGPDDDFAATDEDQDAETQMAADTGMEDARTDDARTDEGLAGTEGQDTGEFDETRVGMTGGEEHTVAGTVTAIDEQAREVTIDHEPVESLNWPAMVMPFQVSDESLLQELEVGERVNVTVADRGDGQFVIQDVDNGGLD